MVKGDDLELGIDREHDVSGDPSIGIVGRAQKQGEESSGVSRYCWDRIFLGEGRRGPIGERHGT